MPAGRGSPVLTLVSPGAGPVELERGGTLVFVLLGFFSMFVSVQREASSSGQRATKLSSIKQKKHGRGKWAAVSAAQAAKALIHFCQTRRPHHGDILTTKQCKKKYRDTIPASQLLELCWRGGRKLATRGQDPRPSRSSSLRKPV